MAYFYGTSGGDQILFDLISGGVVTNPPGLIGTTAERDLIYGYGGGDTINADAGDDHAEGGEGNDTIMGHTGNDYLAGDQGDDRLYGGEGDDVVNGGSGIDYMDGGAGDDTYHVESSGETLTEAGGGGVDTVIAYLSFTLGAGFENLRLGTGAADGTGNELDNEIEGNGLANVIDGRAGSDFLDAGAGNDRLIGGDGSDFLDGGTGDDTMTGGGASDGYRIDSAGDRVIEKAGGGSDYVYSSLAVTTLAAEVEALTLEAGGITGIGNAIDNMIIGNAAGNRLEGGGGADTMAGVYGGSTGGDTMLGGAGDDFLYGDYFYGSSGDADVLRGQGGSDVLIGGAFADTLTGGSGADRFVIYGAHESQPGQRDILRAGDGAIAFQGAGAAGGDLIDLDNIDAIEGTVMNDAFTLGGTGAGRLSLVNAGGNTIVRGNTDADADFELEIVIEDGGVLASAYREGDFVL